MQLLKCIVPPLPNHLASERTTSTESTNSNTFILFPSVLDSANDMRELAATLHKINGYHHDIYIYDNQDQVRAIAAKSELQEAPLSLEETGKWVTDHFTKTDSTGRYVVIGYSYGCIEALATANELAKKDEDVLLYLIDAPAPHLSRQYFTQPTKKATWDLIDIAHAAAKLHGLKNQYVFEDFDAEELKDLPLNERIDRIAQCIVEAQEEINADKQSYFLAQLTLIKQNINKLIDYKLPLPLPSADASKISIFALITEQTAAKYCPEDASAVENDKKCRPSAEWNRYGCTFNSISHDELNNLAHTEILTYKASHILADEISKTLQDPTYYCLKMVAKILQEINRLSSRQVTDQSDGYELRTAERLLHTAQELIKSAKIKSPSNSPTYQAVPEQSRSITRENSSSSRGFLLPGSPRFFAGSPQPTIERSPSSPMKIATEEHSPSSSFSDDSSGLYTRSRSGSLTPPSQSLSGHATPLMTPDDEQRHRTCISPSRA